MDQFLASLDGLSSQKDSIANSWHLAQKSGSEPCHIVSNLASIILLVSLSFFAITVYTFKHLEYIYSVCLLLHDIISIKVFLSFHFYLLGGKQQSSMPRPSG